MSKTHFYSINAFLGFSRPYRWRALIVIIVFALSNIALAVVPLFIGKLVGALSSQPVRGHEAVIYAWVLVACSTLHNIGWRGAELLHRKYINPLSYEYESRLFQAVIQKPYPYFVDKFTGKLSSYISTTASEMRQFVDDFFYNYVSHVVSIVSISIILTSINWQTGVIFTSGVIGMIAVGRYTAGKSNHYEKIGADVNSNKNAKIVDAIANFVNIKSFRKEHREIRRIIAEKDKMVRASSTSVLWQIIFWGSMSVFVRDIIWPLTIGINVYLFLHGQIDIAQLTIVMSTILIFSTAIWDVVWEISQVNLRLARLEEAHRYLFGKVSRLPAPSGSSDLIPAFTSSLEFKNLSFAYPDKTDTDVLKNINLRIRHGEKVGIVGHSGSGKSTLTKLLLDYYEVDQSALLLDGQPASSGQVSQLISYVPQDTTLFHRTIAENIAYASEHRVTQEDIETAARRAHAADFIAGISGGYDALVGERGVKLSVGQRQRIAIARAFLDDKPLLILDEATSALDSESEILVQNALEALWENKTVIAIAHRLSTLRHMDRIVVMDKGRIIEEGSHASLLKKKGAYAKLWGHQSGGFIED